MLFRADVLYPDARGPAYPRFERGWEFPILLLGPGSSPEATDVLLGFPESAFSICNEGTVFSFGVGVLSVGVFEMIPIGSEGVQLFRRKL